MYPTVIIYFFILYLIVINAFSNPKHLKQSISSLKADVPLHRPLPLHWSSQLITEVEATSLPLLVANFPASSVIFSLIGLYGMAKFGIYWYMQLKTAELLSGIPPNLSIVEYDAKDGKNIFYLPRGSDYTAIMTIKDIKDIRKVEDKRKLNEQLILECIGKANKEGSQLSGKVRVDAKEVAPASVDCVVSVGSMQRLSSSTVLQDCYRYLNSSEFD
jgi:hypothetical protein